MVDPRTKAVDLDRFREYFIPVFRSKIEYELFKRKVIRKGQELGAEEKKIEQMTQ